MKKRLVLLLLPVFILSIFISSCAPTAQPLPTAESPESEQIDWRTIPLTDVRTGEIFTIGDFSGRIILVESFAVWCPVCTKQQQEIKKLHEDVGEAVISISLDTDPNEDAQKVLEAVQERGFTWRFAISSSELTKALIAEFGSAVVNAPIAPIILVCEDQSTRFLGRGTKNVEELKMEIQRGC